MKKFSKLGKKNFCVHSLPWFLSRISTVFLQPNQTSHQWISHELINILLIWLYNILIKNAKFSPINFFHYFAVFLFITSDEKKQYTKSIDQHVHNWFFFFIMYLGFNLAGKLPFAFFKRIFWTLIFARNFQKIP